MSYIVFLDTSSFNFRYHSTKCLVMPKREFKGLDRTKESTEDKTVDLHMTDPGMIPALHMIPPSTIRVTLENRARTSL